MARIGGGVMRAFALAIALLAVGGLARADEDPNPPDESLQKLQGTWSAVRAISKGEEKKVHPASYTFTKGQAVYSYGSGKPQTMTLKAGKNRPDVFELTPEKGKTTRWFFKIENGELHMVPDRSDDPKAKPDFSSNTIGVLILRREKN